MNIFVMHFFSLLAALTAVYSVLCIIRIFLSWIPSLAYSKAGFIIAKICDPYLNIFRHIRFLTFGGIDFSPALALCVLSAVSTLFRMLSFGSPFTVFLIPVIVLSVIETVTVSILSFVIIVLLIRIFILVINPYSTSPVLSYLDQALQPFASKISRTFSFGRKLSYIKMLIITAVFLAIISTAVIILLRLLASLMLVNPTALY